MLRGAVILALDSLHRVANKIDKPDDCVQVKMHNLALQNPP